MIAESTIKLLSQLRELHIALTAENSSLRFNALPGCPECRDFYSRPYSWLSVTAIERMRREGFDVDVRRLFLMPTINAPAGAMEIREVRI